MRFVLYCLVVGLFAGATFALYFAKGQETVYVYVGVDSTPIYRGVYKAHQVDTDTGFGDGPDLVIRSTSGGKYTVLNRAVVVSPDPIPEYEGGPWLPGSRHEELAR